MEKSNLSKITIILRGYDYLQVHCVCEALIGSSIKNVEITTNSSGAFETVRKIKEEFGKLLNVGCGTVLNMEHAKNAVEANADFILSPIALNKTIIDYCKSNGVVTVPAAITPTEISNLFESGADVVKIFPARDLGIKFASDIQAPLGKLPLMAVGGVNIENVMDFLGNGYEYVGIGSGIFDKNDILNMNKNNLKNSLLDFEAKLDEK